jgi:HPt (histidine-containing phosphotransfer) domain-containing protein
MAEANPVVDWSVFSKTRSELGPGLVRILGYFREDGEKAVARIEEAMRRRDAAALVNPAHALKSEARQFGAEALGELAEEIEYVGRRAVESHLFPDHLVPQVARLRPLYQETVDQFEQESNPLAQRRPPFGRGGPNNQDFGRL